VTQPSARSQSKTKPKKQTGLVTVTRRADCDLRALVEPQIISQGPRPLCVPFALSLVHEARRTSEGASPEALSPESIWRFCTNRRQTGPDGMLITDAAAALAAEGQPSLHLWPYNTQLGVLTEDPPANVGNPPWYTRDIRELHLAHDGIENDLEDHLAAAAPIVLIVEVTNEFLGPDNQGYIGLPDLRAPASDYHAVVCLGAATHPTRGRHLLIRNSWGTYWGLGGYGWLPIEYLIAFVPYAAIMQPSPLLPNTP
jgi:hypothetical protein